MTMKGLKRIFTGPLPLFLLLWAIMMCFLGWLTWEKRQADVKAAVDSICAEADTLYRNVWNNDLTSLDQKQALLSYWLDNQLYPYNGVIQFRFLDAQGQEVARSQMAKGRASLGPWSNYSWFLLLDPVLSQEEQLDLAQRLQKETAQTQKSLTTQNAAFQMAEQSSEDRAENIFYTVEGVKDAGELILYPKSITYVCSDQEIVLLDSHSDFFDGKEITTICVDSLQLSSALAGRNVSPQELLSQWQEVEQRVDLMSSGLDMLPDDYVSSSDVSGTTSLALADGFTMVYGYSYNLTHLILEDLCLIAPVTLLAAIAMALFTDWRQRLAIQRERDFARAAAHELKTPLAVLRAHAEALREDIAPEKREQYLDVVLSESDRMAALVGHLLELSRLESGTAPKRESVALAPLVREVLSPLALPMEQKNLRLQAELEEVSLTGDRARLGEAVENPLSNALRHAIPGGVIQVKLEQLGSRARLTVYNDGPNIPPEELPRLWEPFYRADPSRSRDSGGTGLGLAIAGKTVLAHRGQYWTENRPGGVAFIMELPIS